MDHKNEYIAEPPHRRADRPKHSTRGICRHHSLQTTLERLVDIEDGTILVQINDRAPQHLYPKLDDRDCEYETTETDDGVITVIWNGLHFVVERAWLVVVDKRESLAAL